jgi:hypothetical protein
VFRAVSTYSSIDELATLNSHVVYYADLPPGSPHALAREVGRLQNASLSMARTPDADPH